MPSNYKRGYLAILFILSLYSPRQGARALLISIVKSAFALLLTRVTEPRLMPEKGIILKRTISAMVGKGSVSHNERKFHAENTDPTRSHLNMTFCNENIKVVYHQLFDEAQERYNQKQTRADRKIQNYYEKIRSGKQEKLFHELILQIGNKDDTSSMSIEGEQVKQILAAYMDAFQERNPTLRVFSAHLHMDEATPHLHIDFVPYITGSKRGMDTRVSLKQALGKLGFQGDSRNETEWNLWVQHEKQMLADVMLEYGIEWEKLGTHEEHLSVLDFKKQERSKEIKLLDAALAEKHIEMEAVEHTLNEVQTKAIELEKIESVEAKKALLSDRVILPRSDFENLMNAAKQYVIYRRQDEELQKLLDAANQKIKKLEKVIDGLKEKIVSLTREISNLKFWWEQEVNDEQEKGKELRKENSTLKREKSMMVKLLEKYNIPIKNIRERE